MAISIDEERPDSPDAVRLIAELDEYLHQLNYPPESIHTYSADRLVSEGFVFLVARKDNEPVACGGVKLIGDEYAEVKRMFVRPGARGSGLAKLILNRLEGVVSAAGVKIIRLETGIFQPEAIGLYERYGFKRRAPFAGYEEDPTSVYFEKSLDDSVTG